MADDSGFAGEYSASELARLLVDEFANWYRNLVEKGAIPRAFTAVTTQASELLSFWMAGAAVEP
ncbi:hypothetical protein [Bradyrhizobium sp. AUGA SZCCT0283]|uniref:hypothetical protein n=1 Tax=Bradyrhizobium sp. AUGA SZCCT0283 TaxID=2807671 RepID=UPI001BA63DF5|nr:hypothetical protein [Bradyrhizobium sp. AUGA SZCCT0283]MBR1274287.1 hypothetical protein [Bradyrhizobium sp. AUGA SZCCT0283]